MIEESEEYITRLVDVSPVAMVVSSGTDERVVLVNRKFTELFGYTIEDMPDVAHWWPLAYPEADYREEIKAHWSEKVERAIKNQSEIEPMETTVRCKDSSRRHIDFRLSSTGQWHLVTFTDLTERRHIEDALRKSEDDLKEAQRVGKIGSWEWDAITDTITWSPEYYRIYNIDPKLPAPKYMEHLKTYTHESAERLGAAVAKSMKTGEPYELELEIAHPSAETRWVFARGEAKRDTSDRIVGLRGTAQDITERKKAEMEREQYFRFFQTSADLMCIADPNGAFMKTNPACSEQLGYSETELVAKPFVEFVHPDDKQSTLDEMARQLQRGFSLNFENRYIRKDGSVRWLSWRAIHNKDEGITYATARDITEHKQAEELLHRREQEFRTLVENSPDIVARYDRECRRIYVNPAYLKATDIPVQELLGTSPAQVSPLSAELAASLHDLLRKVIDTATSAEMDLVWHKADNTKRCFFIRAVPEFDPEGRVVSVMSISRDITERKRAEEEILKLNVELEQRVVERTADFQKQSKELQDSQRALMNIVEDLNQKTLELEQANAKLMEFDRLKSMFIASMSHELRTPLNSIIGFSSILLDEWVGHLNNEQKENLSTVLRSAKHLLALINDVIDVSKIEAGRIDVIIEDFDLSKLISEAVALLKKEIDEKGLHVKVDSIGQAMHSDRRRLFQCVVNLFSNAVKFTEKGEISVRTVLVKGKDAEPAPDLVEITITDTGIGIKEEDMPKLFSAFVRIPSPLSLKVKGTGLGLYLVKKIGVDILKGDVTAKSTYGEGSSFCLKIPANL